MPTVIVLGSQGAGKTTILGKASGYKGIKVVNIGDLMTQFAIKQGYVKKRDEIRYKINWKDYQSLYKLAYSKAGSMPGNIVIDTHPSIKAGDRYIPGMPAKYLKLLKNLVGLVYIDADTDAVIRRRKLDPDRVREEDDAKVIDTHRLLNLSILGYYSSCLNIPLYIINNKDGMLQESISEFKKAISDLFGE
jgi:adenylate kinase